MIKLLFRRGEKTKLHKEENGKIWLDINVGEVKTSAELHKILEDKLSKCSDAIEIDRDSYREFKFGFGDLERDLVLGIVYSTGTFVSFSMKREEDRAKDLKKWKLVGGDWSREVSAILNSYDLVKTLQNTPPNFMMPENFVDEAKNALKGIKNVEITDIHGKSIVDEKLGLIAAVGQASDHGPRLLIIKYSGDSGSKEWTALVGKGVCYDSGGLNIKTGSYMSSMKFDMSGGAVSLGVIKALAENQSKRNVVVAIPLVENAVSSNSYRPDDVLVCRNGMSVEIDNTDAEGRLVLADSLAYVVDTYKPKEVITIATLTGAIGYALGSKYGGAWATDEEQWVKLHACSRRAGEWIWRMPLDDYYLKALKKTRVADIKNSARTGAGGSSRAAMFLKEFTNNLPYIHLDIANIDHCENTKEPVAPLMRTLYFYLFQ